MPKLAAASAIIAPGAIPVIVLTTQHYPPCGKSCVDPSPWLQPTSRSFPRHGPDAASVSFRAITLDPFRPRPATFNVSSTVPDFPPRQAAEHLEISGDQFNIQRAGIGMSSMPRLPPKAGRHHSPRPPTATPSTCAPGPAFQRDRQSLRNIRQPQLQRGGAGLAGSGQHRYRAGTHAQHARLCGRFNNRAAECIWG